MPTLTNASTHAPMGKLLLLLSAAALLAGCAGMGGGGAGMGPRYDYSSSKSPENDFERTGFGASGLPFWMGLTAPEIRALKGREKAAAGEPAALLDLAILGSGSPRTQAGYDSIHARVDAFAARVKADIDAEPKAYGKGQKLFRAMHAEFFGAPGKPHQDAMAAKAQPTPEEAGYDFDQSALSPIFPERRFNCVSSAILYVILCKRFGLDAEGVVLRTHAFAQIRTAEGKLIEVETTTPTGFDWVHDEAFYKQRAGSFFASRGLRSSFKDYQARETMGPLAFIARNMNNQHTHPVRMAQADRCRLMEARAYMAPGDREGQSNRFAVWAFENEWLAKRKDHKTLAAMYAAVQPELTAARIRWKDDPELCNRVAWAWYGRASALKELGKGEEGLAYVDSLFAAVRVEEKNGPPVKRNGMALVQMTAVELAEKDEYVRSESVLARFPALESQPEFRKTRAWLYSRWAADRWNAEDWAGAIAKMERQKDWAGLDQRKAIMDNSVKAYLNWASGHEQAGEWTKTRDVLAQCAEKTADKRCRDLLAQFVAQHKFD